MLPSLLPLGGWWKCARVGRRRTKFSTQDVVGQPFLALVQRPPEAGRTGIVPSGLDQDPPRVLRAGLGDRPVSNRCRVSSPATTSNDAAYVERAWTSIAAHAIVPVTAGPPSYGVSRSPSPPSQTPAKCDRGPAFNVPANHPP